MSGHLFDDVGHVTIDQWNESAADLYQLLKDVGVTHVAPVGSTGLQPLTGDIDLAVAHPMGRDVLANKLSKRFDVKKTGNDLVSFRYLLGATWVQVDLMVGNVNFIQWSRAGSTDTGVKNSARAVLLNVALRWYSELYMSSENDDIERQRYTLDFGRGLNKVHQTRVGKDGKTLKQWKTLTSEFISDDPDYIVKMVFGHGATIEETKTFSGCVRALKGSMLYIDQQFIKRRLLPDFLKEIQELAEKNPLAFGDIDRVKQIVTVERASNNV